MLFVFVFIFGTIIGSFINVAGLRYKSGRKAHSGRSACLYCNTKLRWYELIPTLSFFLLKGRCRTCKLKISWQYPIVEFLTGFVFVFILERQIRLWPLYSSFSSGLFYSILFFAYYAVVFGLLMTIVIYDIQHKIIPNRLVYTFIILALLKLVLFFFLKHFQISTIDLFDIFAPILLFAPFALLWFFSGGKWIGFGDAKLAFGIGALVGFVSGVSAIILAFWFGALWGISILWLNRKRKFSLGREVPFAPFLVAGIIIAFTFNVDVLSLGKIFQLFQ